MCVSVCMCECFLEILPKIIMPIIVSVDLLSAAAFQIQMTEPNCVSKYKNDRRRRSCGILAGSDGDAGSSSTSAAADLSVSERERSRDSQSSKRTEQSESERERQRRRASAVRNIYHLTVSLKYTFRPPTRSSCCAALAEIPMLSHTHQHCRVVAGSRQRAAGREQQAAGTRQRQRQRQRQHRPRPQPSERQRNTKAICDVFMYALSLCVCVRTMFTCVCIAENSMSVSGIRNERRRLSQNGVESSDTERLLRKLWVGRIKCQLNAKQAKEIEKTEVIEVK